MADAQPSYSPEDTLERILTEARDTAREKLDSLWDELGGRVRQHLEVSLEERARTGREQGAGKVRRQFSSELNQVLRRLRHIDGETRWASVLLEATANLCDRAALFLVQSGFIQLQGAREIIVNGEFRRLPISSAPAFTGVAETRDTVVSLRSRSELSDPVAELVGERPDRRCWLFPVKDRDRLVAILYADAEDHIEIEALELVTGIAGLAIERLSVPAAVPETRPAVNGPAPAPASAPEAHLRAQRFARVQVSQLQLYHSDAVQDGRRERNLYAHLRTEIDFARATFRRDFLKPSPAMPDYFHEELVRTLANNDGNLLGPDYPGPMG
jgi:hypothetical protein